MNRKFFHIVKKLDDSKFKPLPKKGNLQAKVLQLEENCWSMFPNWNRPLILRMLGKILGIKQNTQHPDKFCVSDFAWTEQVEEAFRNHSYHKRFLKNNKNNCSVQMFLLDMLPATVVTEKSTPEKSTPDLIIPSIPWPRITSTQEGPTYSAHPAPTPEFPVNTIIKSEPHMTKGQLCTLLETAAVLYLKGAKKSIRRNIHQFSFCGTYNHKFAMAVLIDYINFVARGQGLDLGLEEKHILNPTP